MLAPSIIIVDCNAPFLPKPHPICNVNDEENSTLRGAILFKDTILTRPYNLETQSQVPLA
jgi:hypothetical protein